MPTAKGDRHDHAQNIHDRSARFAFNGTALAAELFTSPFAVTSGLFECRILNVSKTARTVRVQLFDTQDNVIDDTGEVALEPLGDLIASGIPAESPFFCKFIVQGSKTGVRASASRRDGGNTLLVVPAE